MWKLPYGLSTISESVKHNTQWVKMLIYGIYAKKEEAAEISSIKKVGELLSENVHHVFV